MAREGLQIWGVLGRIVDFKGLLWSCLVSVCGEGAWLEKAVAMWL